MSTATSWNTFHNTFPKVLFPQETFTEAYAERQYILGPATTSKTTHTAFNLGVYNIHPLSEVKNGCNSFFSSRSSSSASPLAPVDPLCFLTLLSILDNEGLKLPTLSAVLTNNQIAQQVQTSSVSILSYHAAIDDQLPILIEDSKDTENKQIKRKIHHSKLINSLISSNLDTGDKLTFTLINETIFDFYTLMLLKLDDLTLLDYYSLLKYNYTESIQSMIPLLQFLAKSARLHLLKRNDFHVRNPDTFNYFSSIMVPKYVKLSYQHESNVIVDNAKELISHLNDVLSSQLYWNEEKADIIDLQVASYVYCFGHMSEHVPLFKNIVNEYDGLVQHANRVIGSFV